MDEQSNDAAVRNTRDQAVQGKVQEIHEDDRDIDGNADIRNTLSSYGFDEKYEEEESWEENLAQKRTTTDKEQTETSRWGEDWNEEEEEEIRKMNQQRTTKNGDGNSTGQNKGGNRGTELGTSSAVQDWPWAAENAPLPGEYRPWPGKPPSRPIHAAVSITRNQAGKGKDQEINEDDSDDNLDNLNTRSSYGINEKYEEEESWEEKEAQTRTTTDDEQTKTSRWREDWNEEEEEEIREMNQRPTPNGEGNSPTPNEEGNRSTELVASLAVQDWPWSAENAPLPGDYRPWPGNPPARPNHADGRSTQDQPGKGKDQGIHEDDSDSDVNRDNLNTLSSDRNPPASPERETKQQAEGVRIQAEPRPPARESTGRAGLNHERKRKTRARRGQRRTRRGQQITSRCQKTLRQNGSQEPSNKRSG
jgi:hypothetical protein